jgi:predicted lipid-binding transport protein (Tim44 family)
MNSFVDGFMGSLGTAAGWGLVTLLVGIVAVFGRLIIMRLILRRYITRPIEDAARAAGTLASDVVASTYETGKKVGAAAYEVAGNVGADAAAKMGIAGATAHDAIRAAGATTYEAATKAGSVAYDATTAVAATTRKLGDGLLAKVKGE